jgi:hypothetical protein
MRAHRSISPYLCAAIGLLAACSSSPTGPSETKQPALPPGATVVLMVAPSKATIEHGQVFQLTASRANAQGQSIAPTEIVWASSNLRVARIGSDGTVLGAGLGTAQITAEWHGMRGASTITVLDNEPLSGTCPNLSVAGAATIAQAQLKCPAR